MTNADKLDRLKDEAREAKRLGKSQIAVPINLLLALELRGTKPGGPKGG